MAPTTPTTRRGGIISNGQQKFSLFDHISPEDGSFVGPQESTTTTSPIGVESGEVFPTTTNTTTVLQSETDISIQIPHFTKYGSKVRYHVELRVGPDTMTCQRRYSDLLKFHQRIGRVLKMSRELQSLFPTKMAFLTKQKESARKRQSDFEKYFVKLVQELINHVECFPNKEWMAQAFTILLDELFGIQYIEDVVNSMKLSNLKQSEAVQLKTNLLQSLRISIGLKNYSSNAVANLKKPYEKFFTISEILAQDERMNRKYLLGTFNMDTRRASTAERTEIEREYQNTEYQILKLNLNRYNDRQNLDSIIQSLCSTLDVSMQRRRYHLKHELTHLLDSDSQLKQIYEKGERAREEFMSEGFKQVFASNTIEDSSKTVYSQSDIEQVKNTCDSLKQLSKQAKENELKCALLLSQLQKAILSQDKQLVQKTVEQIHVKSEGILGTTEKLAEIIRDWYMYFELSIANKIQERCEIPVDYILVFLLPFTFPLLASKGSFVSGGLSLYLGLRSQSITLEFESVPESELCTTEGSLSSLNDSTSSPSVNEKKKKKTSEEDHSSIPKVLYGSNVLMAIRNFVLLNDSYYSSMESRFDFLKRLWASIMNECSKEIEDWTNVCQVLQKNHVDLSRLLLNYDDDSTADDFFRIEQLTKQKMDRVIKGLKEFSEYYCKDALSE